jgi:hypothetical protein
MVDRWNDTRTGGSNISELFVLFGTFHHYLEYIFLFIYYVIIEVLIIMSQKTILSLCLGNIFYLY